MDENFLVFWWGFWLGLVFSLVQACVPVLVEQQVGWASNTSDSLSVEAGDVLSWLMWVSNVSTEVWSTSWAFVWAGEGGGWFPWLCGDTFVFSVVQTLVASFAEFQGQWPTGLA